MKIDRKDTEEEEKDISVSNNGIKIPFNGYNYDPYFADNLEPILKELQELRRMSNKKDSPLTTLIAKKTGVDEHSEGLQNKNQYNGTQLIYSYFVWIISLATTLVSSDNESEFNSNKLSLNSLKTISSILLL